MVVLLFGVALTSAPATAQESEPDQADLILRFWDQVTFTIWGNGTTANAFFVEARAGDALHADLKLVVFRDRNTLESPREFTVRMLLSGLSPGFGSEGLGENETQEADAEGVLVLGRTNGTVSPEDTGSRSVVVNATLPENLPEGRYAIRFVLETGPWDPDEANNDPRIPSETTIQVGPPEHGVAGRPFQTRHFIGPIIAASLIAVPFLLRPLRANATMVRLRAASVRRWEDATAAWIHMAETRRSRITLLAAIVGFFLLALLAVFAGGGIAFGLEGLLDGVFLGLLAASLHVWGGAVARRRRAVGNLRDEGEEIPPGGLPLWPFARDAVLPAALTAGLVLVGALFWQQMAAVTGFLRWPEFSALDRHLANSITIGAIYALIAIGYTMVYGILKFINFAHGEVFMWGSYLAWVFVVGWAPFGFGFQTAFIIAVLMAIALTGLLGAGIERVAYRPLRGGSRLMPLVTAIAVSLTLQATAQFFFGAQAKTYTSTRAGRDYQVSSYAGSGLQDWFANGVVVFDAPMSYLNLTTIGLAVVLMVALHLFVKHSRTGQAIRATADDMDTARTIGIDVDRVVTWTFVIGSMLAAVGGVFYALHFNIQPTMGLFVGIKAFTAAVVGGIGNIYGAFLGGFLIGLAENVGGQFISSEFLNVIVFAILIAFLLFRPQGILGSSEEVKRR